MAFTEASIIGGVATFLFYGLLPVALILWLGGTRARRRKPPASDPDNPDGGREK